MKTPFLCLKALFGRKRKTAGIFLFIPRILKRYFAFRVKVSAFFLLSVFHGLVHFYSPAFLCC